jgi:hypothetical protein
MRGHNHVFNRIYKLTGIRRGVDSAAIIVIDPDLASFRASSCAGVARRQAGSRLVQKG